MCCRAALIVWCLLAGGRGWTAMVPNGSFELTEDGAVAGWRLGGGAGAYAPGAGRGGGACVTVSRGAGETSWWQADCEGLAPGGVYEFSFWARTVEPGPGGCLVSGPPGMNMDFQAGADWTRHAFLFPVPSGHRGPMTVRVGTWMKNATVAFDDVQLARVDLFHRREGGIELGEGERIDGRTYAFATRFEKGACSRPLEDFRCGFNSTRWVFGEGQYVDYAHRVPGREMTRAAVNVHIGYRTGGALEVCARRDGGDWVVVGAMDAIGTATFDLPAALFPAARIDVRLRRAKAPAEGIFQVYAYGIEAALDGDKGLALEGTTRALVVVRETPGVEVDVRSVGDLEPGGDNRLAAVVRAAPGLAGVARLTLEGGASVVQPFRVGDDGAPLSWRYDLARAGTHAIGIAIEGADGASLYQASLQFEVPPLLAADYGRLVPGAAPLGAWWCTATEKVGRRRPAPEAEAPLTMEAARLEEEALQLVLRPPRRLRGVRVRLEAPAGVDLSPRVREVAYVDVKVPSDYSGCVGPWPDPLPEHDAPLDLEAGRNQPFWLSVRVGPDVPKGLHALWAVVSAEGMEPVRIPIALRVFDFSLPAAHSIRTAFGFSEALAARYHRVTGGEDRRALFDLYMQNFRDHRISPYNFAPFDPMRVTIAPADGGDGEQRVSVDFTAWDRQARTYLDGYKFDSFRLLLRGLGGGTFHSRSYGSFGSHKQGTEEYRRLMRAYASQVEAHLRGNGWLDKAYIYWFDEPEEKDYDFVKEGMDEIRRAAPGLRRMLTEEPVEALIGYVDIWCPVLHHADPAAVRARVAAGEEVWWYVCTGPKAPYLGLFIDHPATDLRVWLWLSWKYGVTGILVWESNYWTSSAAFPGEPQDPWKDPMGYVSGYGHPPGYIGYWGNGDGRFLYPPREVSGPALCGPVDSIRWEMLREGIEDYEYLALLGRLVAKARERGADVSAAAALLDVPESIVRDGMDYTRRVEPILVRRRAIAGAIEELSARFGQ